MDEFMAIFVACDEECRRTDVFEHSIDVGMPVSIWLCSHLLALAKRDVAEQKIKEMAAAGVTEPSSSP